MPNRVHRGKKLFKALHEGLSHISLTSLLIALVHALPYPQDQPVVFVLRLLGHRFPRIRRHIADNLYAQLLLHDVDHSLDASTHDAVADLVLQTQWDSDMLTSSEIAAAQHKVATMLGVGNSFTDLSTGEDDRNGEGGRTADNGPQPDEFESYASLVNRLSS